MQIGERTALWASGGTAGYTAADYPALENCPILLDGIENYAFGVHLDDVEQWRSLTRPWCFLQRRNLSKTTWNDNSPIIPKDTYLSSLVTTFCDMVGRYGQFSSSMQGLRSYSVNATVKIDKSKNGAIFACGLANSHYVFHLKSNGLFYHRSLYESGYSGKVISGVVNNEGFVSFTFTHDADSGVIKVFSHGEFVEEFVITSYYAWQINSIFAIANQGVLPYSTGDNYNTCVDAIHSLKMYNKVLSAEEIATIYAIDKARFGIT